MLDRPRSTPDPLHDEAADDGPWAGPSTGPGDVAGPSLAAALGVLARTIRRGVGRQFDDPLDDPLHDDRADPFAETPDAALASAELAALPLAGLTRRRVAWIVAAFVAVWVLFAFAQQVNEATRITAQADEMRLANAQLEARLTAAERELERIQGDAWVEQQARAYRLGHPDEIPFALSADAPPLGPDAPGSAANRVGAQAIERTPLETWLSLLFGPVQ